jgi:hypothetical protein
MFAASGPVAKSLQASMFEADGKLLHTSCLAVLPREAVSIGDLSLLDGPDDAFVRRRGPPSALTAA